MKTTKFDIGLIWAKGVNIYGQVGTIASMVSFIMTLGIFYTTTAFPTWHIPLWLYIIVVILGASVVVWFILRWGISGYYRFFSNQSAITEMNKKVCVIMEYLKSNDKEKIEALMKQFDCSDKK